jgi:hypothetical protein
MHPRLTGRGRTRAQVVAWPGFLDSPRTQATVGHATHPPADAGLLRLCFPERNQNLYTSRAILIRSCPQPASPITTCLRTPTQSLALRRNSNQKMTTSPLDPTLRPLLRSPCGFILPTDSSTVLIRARQLARSGAHATAVCTRAARQGFSLSTDVCLWSSCSGFCSCNCWPIPDRTWIAASLLSPPLRYVWRFHSAAGTNTVAQPLQSS